MSEDRKEYSKENPHKDIGKQKFRVRKFYSVWVEYDVVAENRTEAESAVMEHGGIKKIDWDEGYHNDEPVEMYANDWNSDYQAESDDEHMREHPESRRSLNVFHTKIQMESTTMTLTGARMTGYGRRRVMSQQDQKPRQKRRCHSNGYFYCRDRIWNAGGGPRAYHGDSGGGVVRDKRPEEAPTGPTEQVRDREADRED